MKYNSNYTFVIIVKYRKTTNDMGRWFPGGRNRPRGLSLIDDDDDNDDDNNDCKKQILIYIYILII